MKTYAINHTQNKAYEFASKEDAEIWLNLFMSFPGRSAEIVEQKDNKQFVAAYSDMIRKMERVQNFNGNGFVSSLPGVK